MPTGNRTVVERHVKPSLLIVTTTFPRWEGDDGPAPFVYHHARAMTEFFEVTVLAPHFPGAKTSELWEGMRIKRFRYAPKRFEVLADGAGIRGHLRKSFSNKLSAIALIVAEAWAVLRLQEAHHFINSHWLVPSGLAVSLMVRKKTHVITAHAADYDLLKKLPGGDSLIRFMARRARAIVCSGARLSAGITSIVPEARILTRPMGVETRRFTFCESKRTGHREELRLGKAPVVLFVGKLSAKKGVHVLIRSVSLLRRQGSALRLVVAGGGEKAVDLKSLAAKEGIAEEVIFTGPLSNEDIAGLYSASDVVAVPSIRDISGETEGMPVVVLEGLSAGRPVVATDLCSVPAELCGKGVIEVKAGDEKSLAEGIEEALAGKAVVEMEAVKKYDVRETARFYYRLFKGEGM